MSTSRRTSVDYGRLGPKYSSRFHHRGHIPRTNYSAASGSTAFVNEHRDAQSKRKPELEPTYKMEPDVRFEPHAATQIIEKVLKSFLEKETYHPTTSRQTALTLSNLIKDRVKELGLSGYKYVVEVHVGSTAGQSMRIASRFLWNTATDNYASGRFHNSSLFAVAIVYAVYYE
ncbi:dynein light chain Tctex-type 5-B-like [Oscarella lobularis]|uniref:dynein light chain Tctex-type 5-B-like n=1 Tax=Oscarella lobularis TaxID=121494 RepID=UPI0033144EF6